MRKKTWLTLIIYQKFYTEVVKEYPNLTEVAFFRLAYAHFFILDKMLLDDNFKGFKDYPKIYGYLKKTCLLLFFKKYHFLEKEDVLVL